MYYSLLEHCSSFHLYIFAFDIDCYKILTNLKLDFVSVIKQVDFEDDALLSVKNSRTQGEYCWTSSGKTIEYVFNKYHHDMVTYLDADLYFFSSPKEIFDLANEYSVIITPHRYSPEYDQTSISGRYCVQFVTFKNDLEGRKVLKWWTDRCIEWCFNRVEDSRFGDQKYLDYFTELSSSVLDLEHYGAGLAPWNCQQYEYIQDKKYIKIINNINSYNLIFFHFHGLKISRSSNIVQFSSGYLIPLNVLKKIYRPYIKRLLKSEKIIQNDENDEFIIKRTDINHFYQKNFYIYRKKTRLKIYLRYYSILILKLFCNFLLVLARTLTTKSFRQKIKIFLKYIKK